MNSFSETVRGGLEVAAYDPLTSVALGIADSFAGSYVLAVATLALVALGMGALMLAWWLRGRIEGRRLGRMLDQLRRDKELIPEIDGYRNTLDAARASLRYLADALDEERSQARKHSDVRQRIETQLRASEERYALALMGADEGWWEWDLRSGNVAYSERWRCMLGLAEQEVGDKIDDWCRRIHPADRERAQADLKSHLEGHTCRFENEHRLLHQDGSYRWVLARATALRHAGGRAHRLVGLATDVTARRQVQQAVIELADGMEGLQGEECLRGLVRSFARVLGASEVFVCECVDFPATRVRMLARWKAGDYARCVEFPLEGTACADVIRSGRLVYEPTRAGERWPLELQYGRKSYLGVPCIDSRGVVLGHIACADPGSLPEVLPHDALLKIFALRAAMELEWRALGRAQGILLRDCRAGEGLMMH